MSNHKKITGAALYVLLTLFGFVSLVPVVASAAIVSPAKKTQGVRLQGVVTVAGDASYSVSVTKLMPVASSTPSSIAVGSVVKVQTREQFMVARRGLGASAGKTLPGFQAPTVGSQVVVMGLLQTDGSIGMAMVIVRPTATSTPANVFRH